jgi:N-acetylneuraminate lyase
MSNLLSGLVAATHTPFTQDGRLNLDAIESQAEHLARNGVTLAFVAGSTGESHSLTCDERLQLAQRWSEVTRGSPVRWIAHVGSNCLSESQVLAEQAQRLGALAIAALAPSYFKPKSITSLIECCQQIAGAASNTPFYYYDIPALTGVSLPMDQFLEVAQSRIPNLVGIKYSNPDLMTLQACLQRNDQRFEIAWGIDECLLSALVLGVNGAVGSSYNFAAPLYHRLWQAFRGGDLATARREQFRSVQLIRLLAKYGYLESAKWLMSELGVVVGPARLPNGELDGEQAEMLRTGLETLGFFEWVK